MLSKPGFIVSIDVEAVTSRADSDHVKKLIFGDFDANGRQGIIEMMDLADNAGIKLSMFLDMVEVEVHGDIINKVAELIHQRGHDLQLHLHPNLLREGYWHKLGMERPNLRRWDYSEELTHILLEDFGHRMKVIKGNMPECFRAGAFQTSMNWLKSQKRLGIPLSSNHNYASFLNQGREPLAEPNAGIFKWDNDIMEIPVTQLYDGEKWRPFTFPVRNVTDESALRKILEKLSTNQNSNTVIVMLMHSWSLLKYSGVGKKFSGVAENKLKKFKILMSIVRDYFEPMTFTTLKDINRTSLEVRSFPS